jgi:IS5 family transposase
LALFRALLLATWHDLSDVKLAEALDERASFRRFCGFAAHEPTPERTAFVRFRRELVARGLDRVLFDAVTRQLEEKGVMVRTGTLVDATLIPSASIRHDGEARWAGHRRRKPTHGYKAQVATDQAAVLIRSVEVTTATVPDAGQMQVVLPSQPGDVYGDSAFAGRSAERVIIARGGTPQVVHTGTWGRPEALAELKAHNARVQRIRCRIETVFGTWKRCYGLDECAGSASPGPACRSGSPRSPAPCAGPPRSSARLLEAGGVCPRRCRRPRRQRNHPDRSQTRAPILTVSADFNACTTPAHRSHDTKSCDGRLIGAWAVRMSVLPDADQM